LWAGAGWAQDAPDQPDDPPEVPLEPTEDDGGPEEIEPETLPDSFADGWAWKKVGPRIRAGMSDVALHPVQPDTLVAVTLGGEVWMSSDRGESWVVVLAGARRSLGIGSSDEDVIIGVEARVDEIRGGDTSDEEFSVDPDDFVDDPDGLLSAIEEMEQRAQELAQEVADATADALDQVRGEVADGVFFDGASATAEMQSRPRVWFDPDGQLLVGRSDGLHLSRDLGESWSKVLDVGVTAMTRLPERNLWIAGTTDGIRFAVDLNIWIDPEDGTEGLVVSDLAAAGPGVFAATAKGLWFAPDAQSWSPIGTRDEPIQALLVDPGWDGGLWLTNARTVLRSDDGGAHAREGLGAPLPRVTDLAWIRSGQLLAVSADGPWESVDGGTTWSPVPRGLSDPRTQAISIRGLDVVLASAEGIYRLEAFSEDGLEDAPDTDTSPFEEWISVGALIGSAVMRPELTATVGSRLAAAALPELTLHGTYRPEDSLDYVVLAGSTREIGALWSVGLILKWTGSRTSSTDVTPISIGMGTEVVSNLSPATLGGAIRRDATTYGFGIAGDVAEMYYARAELIAERPLLATSSLRDQVDHELSIRELEAQLDHITNGAVSAWSSQ